MEDKIIEFLVELQDSLNVEYSQSMLDNQRWSYRIDELVQEIEDYKMNKDNIYAN